MADVDQETHEAFEENSESLVSQQSDSIQYQSAAENDHPVRVKVASLIEVKSIMTIILVLTLCWQVITGKELDERFMTIVTAVVTFYFSYQTKK